MVRLSHHDTWSAFHASRLQWTSHQGESPTVCRISHGNNVQEAGLMGACHQSEMQQNHWRNHGAGITDNHQMKDNGQMMIHNLPSGNMQHGYKGCYLACSTCTLIHLQSINKGAIVVLDQTTITGWHRTKTSRGRSSAGHYTQAQEKSPQVHIAWPGIDQMYMSLHRHRHFLTQIPDPSITRRVQNETMLPYPKTQVAPWQQKQGSDDKVCLQCMTESQVCLFIGGRGHWWWYQKTSSDRLATPNLSSGHPRAPSDLKQALHWSLSNWYSWLPLDWIVGCW